MHLDSFADAVTIPVKLGDKVPRSYEGQENVCAHGVMRFDLALSLKDASGRILPLQPVHLDLFVPRSQVGYAAARR
ncbi:MAG TPA: hypothetical protein VF173_38590 [Thermoanaerobaculia bacterium]|nr:hypothetical protein [Thermoanaerobaculia bacterium]